MMHNYLRETTTPPYPQREVELTSRPITQESYEPIRRSPGRLSGEVNVLNRGLDETRAIVSRRLQQQDASLNPLEQRASG